MNDGSRAAEVADELRQRIHTAPPGHLLPPTRVLCAEFAASPVTVGRALAQLAAAGLVRTDPGRGTFVLPRRERREPDLSWQAVALSAPRIDAAITAPLDPGNAPGAVPLSWGYLAPELQPRQALQAAFARTSRRGGVWDTAPTAGIPELRRVLAAPVGVDPADVLVVPGGQAALAVVLRTVGTPGAPLLVEDPTYPGAIAAAQAAGMTPVPVPTDADGVRTDLLDDLFARTGAALAYLQPTYANPTGTVTSPQRRAEILQVAARRNAFVLEDDWARHLSLDGQAPRPLVADDPDGHVVHITSLSKPASPSLRIGALVARGPALERLRSARVADDLFVARPLQETAAELLASPEWSRHLKRLRTALERRRDVLHAGLRAALPQLSPAPPPRGGLHLWVRLPAGSDSTAVTRATREAGVLVGDGRGYFAREAPAPYLRLSFGALGEDQVPAAVDVLARHLPG
ncbi:DNA-binding transcriptional MocR family regulator [Kineococcus xinjiangensis]|uniref:DNA-binding transcriptional MocR family regulator n=1 Tax=Kineococcus xinjiangensis TaxID=512762 RepID=A0A2S6ITK6_9ACTN|nr:PLP-dependent aminotransferase family protein [Kineococcus xinjiangensis]PPK97501.1 DNA-binding transcriptional MocR family regulator [Kineococcus xinjiangensis]